MRATTHPAAGARSSAPLPLRYQTFPLRTQTYAVRRGSLSAGGRWVAGCWPSTHTLRPVLAPAWVLAITVRELFRRELVTLYVVEHAVGDLTGNG